MYDKIRLGEDYYIIFTNENKAEFYSEEPYLEEEAEEIVILLNDGFMLGYETCKNELKFDLIAYHQGVRQDLEELRGKALDLTNIKELLNE